MSVSKATQFTLRLTAKGKTERLAMADLFDELDVVSREYHITSVKEMDNELRRREEELDRMQTSLNAANNQLAKLTNNNPPPRCSKLEVIKAMVDLLRPKGIKSEVVSLMDLKKAMDAIW